MHTVATTASSIQPGVSQHRLSVEAGRTIVRAAGLGRERYPGPVGELIERELTTYLHAGYQLPSSSLPERLLAALCPVQASATTEPMTPARYVAGTPLHWEPTPR